MDKIIVLDFGSQYNQLIARRIRELHVYSEVLPFNTDLEKLKDKKVKGIILTGGPNSVYLPSSPKIDKMILDINKPLLGICYGAQLLAYLSGGKVKQSAVGEYGSAIITTSKSNLLSTMLDKEEVFMSHRDRIYSLPKDFIITSSTKDCPIASYENIKKNIYGTQFHPEVKHTKHGNKIFKNFLFNICHCKKEWKYDTFIENKIEEIKEKVQNKKVLLGLSGGVDSSVTAALLSKAIGKNLYCVFIDHGLMRKDEGKEIEETFKKYDLNFISINASSLFYDKLKGIIDPEMKRKIIGSTFLEVFEKEAKKLGEIDYFAQGTIYPDRIESGLGISAKIKSHHNVGGLPSKINFQGIIEPLDMLFKDEVRKVGMRLNLPSSLINRQPFPGPGLGIRIIGEITKEKVKIVQEADYIFRKELKKNNYKADQYFAALSSMKSVGVMGDSRTYDYALILRAVQTDDFMTAKPTLLPPTFLEHISDLLINNVKGINRVFYDYTSKPPATIEFE